MNVVVEPLPNCLATLRVEVDPEKVSETRDAVAREFGQFARIPATPRQSAARGDRAEVQEADRGRAGEKAAQREHPAGDQEQKLRVLQLASIEDVEISDDNAMSFTATVVTQPEFELPNYKGIEIQVRSTDVTDAEIDESIEELRDQAADFMDVTEDRGAQMDDYIVVDYTGTIDGKPVHELFPKAGKPLSGERGFLDQDDRRGVLPRLLRRARRCEARRDSQVRRRGSGGFPGGGNAGQKITYKVTVKAIKEKKLPS